MNLNKTVKILTVVLGGIVLGACGYTGGTKSDAGGAAVEDRSGAQSTGYVGQRSFKREALDDPASPLSHRVIYFEYNRSELDSEGKEILENHAAYMAAYPDVYVVLEGHADERGSREYNIALGERRAQSVRRLLLFQGVSDKQVETVSYGEERPALLGHDDESWYKNRRVELIYKR
ncbi:MAG: peptidoglycan-associated lipoprotein Pal [Gammaproteobacteria bacterium]|nr:peptidoglycan-associated lipoprotein Pal [Gammaproteobacteria bacterium]